MRTPFTGRPGPRQVHLRRTAAAKQQREESEGLAPRQERPPQHGQLRLPQAPRGDRALLPRGRLFALSEQASNTVYALCDRPKVLTNAVAMPSPQPHALRIELSESLQYSTQAG